VGKDVEVSVGVRLGVCDGTNVDVLVGDGVVEAV
jgi:hypothetical protein